MFFVLRKLKKRFLTVEDAIEDFLIYFTNKNISINTRKSYESTLKLFSEFLEEECNITHTEAITEKTYENRYSLQESSI
ncbi:hypothetical protein CFOLD11_08350 [Clostridium folliculivorans]|uniref:Core-binding (CB) domain-containing protein n=1 Tax=Clostridium folliculivorans TaxID=2886038 RepID=A0A9W5XZL6_9CLOT|nr:hypothetical protein CFOLD11_08350 [Clostridium folliculivorans]